MTKTPEELLREKVTADWPSLRAHLERGGLIVVADSLDLVEVALKVTEDDAAAIGQWIKSGLLSKPSSEQITKWDADKQKFFTMLIVSPYILIQEQLFSTWL